MTYLDTTLPTLAENLALDEALLQAAEDGQAGPSLRLWEWTRYAVVLGASGRIGREVHRDACRADGVEIARRSSGGGTVLIGPGALNFAVVLPVDAAAELAAVDTAQHFVLDRVARSIAEAGPGVEVLGTGDLVLGGRKISGSAQRRLRRHVMIHATVLYDFPLDRITRYLAAPPREPAYRAGRPHAEFVRNLPLGRDALADALRRAWRPEAAAPAPELEDMVRELVAAKFADPSWIERL